MALHLRYNTKKGVTKMDNYITGATIKALREKKGYTQTELAEILGVSSKAVSKWETAKGLPDITLIESLANALSVSVIELMSGNTVTNKNLSANVLRSKLYVCPVCNNVIRSVGDAVVSCHGITLPPLEAEETDDAHHIIIEKVEDEHFVTVHHDMTKEHYISFVALITGDTVMMRKQYPEWNLQVRIPMFARGRLVWHCTQHGLFYQDI